MPQLCNGLAPEERADILRVRPQGALCKCSRNISSERSFIRFRSLGGWGTSIHAVQDSRA